MRGTFCRISECEPVLKGTIRGKMNRPFGVAGIVNLTVSFSMLSIQKS